MTTAELVQACARDLQNSELWAEFLRRYRPKILQFIHGASWRLRKAASSNRQGGILSSHPDDLFQNTMIRLVENDCALMKRFAGTTEDEWMAYLAIITRSVARNSVRRDRRQGRGESAAADRFDSIHSQYPRRYGEMSISPGADRRLLLREVMGLCWRAIRMTSGKECSRDMLILHLRFVEGRSIQAIAEHEGICLSRKGVQKVINRLMEHARGAAAGDSKTRHGICCNCLAGKK